MTVFISVMPFPKSRGESVGSEEAELGAGTTRGDASNLVASDFGEPEIAAGHR